MQALKDRISKDGILLPGGIVKVDSFLNHQLDPSLLYEIGRAFYQHYKDCGITKVPESFAVGNGSIMKFSPDAAFWVFNQVSNLAYTRYNAMIPEIQKKQRELELKYIDNTSIIDKAAVDLYNTNKEKGIQYITDYSVNTGNSSVKEWQQLQFLLMVWN